MFSSVTRSNERPDRNSILALLLDNGAPVNAHGINDWTPAHMAAVREDIEVPLLLTEHGATLSIPTHVNDCKTPLEEARSLGQMVSVRFLEEKGNIAIDMLFYLSARSRVRSHELHEKHDDRDLSPLSNHQAWISRTAAQRSAMDLSRST
ncbi:MULTISPECIES: hypothetical protein [unclassified Rhizobium]|uniref:hypothetical protein n=1 Tax=unclassified Rhizobium TaxID=2613769 RepID=UPI0013C42495|nr:MULTISPECIES: hypothetical protein [unclassified Rhizobium]